jgi:hypothetical protein
MGKRVGDTVKKGQYIYYIAPSGRTQTWGRLQVEDITFVETVWLRVTVNDWSFPVLLDGKLEIDGKGGFEVNGRIFYVSRKCVLMELVRQEIEAFKQIEDTIQNCMKNLKSNKEND